MSIRITVRYSAQARQAVGQASESLELEGATSVRDLLKELSSRHPSLQRLFLSDAGEPHPSLLVFVREEQVAPDSPRMLVADDEVCILPPIAGG